MPPIPEAIPAVEAAIMLPVGAKHRRKPATPPMHSKITSLPPIFIISSSEPTGLWGGALAMYPAGRGWNLI